MSHFDGVASTTPTAADMMLLVEKYLVTATDTAGLSADAAAALKTEAYAKMRVYFDTNKLPVTDENVAKYRSATLLVAGQPSTSAVSKRPQLVLALVLLVLASLIGGSFFFLTRKA